MSNNSKNRFSSRAQQYESSRPGYPIEVYDLILSDLDPANSTIADVGAGTGFVARTCADRGFSTIAVEPNEEMLKVGKFLTPSLKNLSWLKGSAEELPLEDHSCDRVIAAQAFHWFNQDQAQREFKRCLKKEGRAVLLFNERRTDNDFLTALEECILQHSVDYSQVDHRQIDQDQFDHFFNTPTKIQKFKNSQKFDLKSFNQRIQSMSYMPKVDSKEWPKVEKDLEELFHRFSNKGKVIIEYWTLMVCSQFWDAQK